MSGLALGRPTQGLVRAGRGLAELAARPAGWVVALLVLAAALAVGSIHPAPPTRAARISALESSLKCPNCVDLSIRQSDTAAAANLRAEVVRLVDRGETNAQIEATVVAQYGSSELLSPPSSGIDTVAWALPVAALVGGGAILALFLARRRRTAGGTGTPSAQDEALVLAALGRAPDEGEGNLRAADDPGGPLR